jgi:hypothetical protein
MRYAVQDLKGNHHSYLLNKENSRQNLTTASGAPLKLGEEDLHLDDLEFGTPVFLVFLFGTS